jgi:solute carrier family 25 phosphate transporter 3
MVPVDVVKTRMQLAPATYPSTRVAFRSILRSEGAVGLSLGLGPTCYGYLTQGFFKYGLYETFKTYYAKALGQERAERYAHALYLGAGMTAEAIADIFLAPFEAVRIRLVADPRFARGTFSAIGKVAATEGVGGLYKGFAPLVMKQVPYTAVKLMVFEACEEYIYDHLMDKPRSELSNPIQLGVTTVSGFIGGIASAVVSHPADTVLTKVNATEGGLWEALKQVGLRGMWAGLIPRMGMVGVLAALQLLVYDGAKVTLFNLPTSQGIKNKATVHQ